METTRATYRGITAPTRVNDAPTSPVTQSGPRYQRAAEPATARDYSASDILQNVIRKHMRADCDSTSAFQGATPAVAFAGIHEPRVAMKDVTPATSIAVGDHDLVFFQAAGKPKNPLLSAKMSNGMLTKVDSFNFDYKAFSTPLLVGESKILLDGLANGWVTVDANGRFGKERGGRSTGDSESVLAPGVLVTNRSGTELEAWRLGETRREKDGRTLALARMPIKEIPNTVRKPLVYNGMVVMFDENCFRTLRLQNGAFVELDCITNDFGLQGHLLTPFIAANGTIVASSTGGTLRAGVIAPDGKVKMLAAAATYDANSWTSPIVFNNVVVGPDSNNAIRTFRVTPQGLEPAGSFPAGGVIEARPTITRDGVVLVGTLAGELLALKIQPDGTLAQLDRKQLGEPLPHSVSVTRDGFVLVPGKTNVFVAGGKQNARAIVSP